MQVPVPGVAQVTYGGTFGSQPWAVVHHWRLGTSTADWSSANLTSLVNAASSAFATRFASHMPVSVSLRDVRAVDIGAAVPAVGENTTVHPGTGTGTAFSASSGCCVISNHIGARYKGGHPRSYWPFGTQQDVANEFQFTTTFIGVIAQAMANYIEDIVIALPGSGAGAANHCVPLYTYEVVNDSLNHKYKRIRNGLKAVYTVQSYSANLTYGTQRRRLHA